MLSERYNATLPGLLIDHDHWHPHPTASERDAWSAYPAPLRRAHIQRGEKASEYGWPVPTATFFLDFQRTGNRSRWQKQIRDTRRQTLADLLLAECFEGQGRFIDPIIDGIWATCEETFWGVPAHMSRQKAGVGLPDVEEPVVELFSAEAASLLAWTLYLLDEQLDEQSRLIADRIRLEIDRRILTPCLERDFNWMGFNNTGRRVNNWNPWIISNWLTCALIIETDIDRRTRLVSRAIEALDNFIDPYPHDGGCDEGPGYWNHAGGALFDCLEILHNASDGRIDVYDDPKIQEIGRFPYRTQIHENYFVNFADAAARISLPPALTFGYGKRINDADLMAIGAWSADRANILEEGLTDSLGRQLRSLTVIDELLGAGGRTPLPRSTWLSDIEVYCARDTAGTSSGLFVAGKGGNNEESHNHNDIGSYVVYIDGKPLIVDIGVEDYTAKTFGPDRYDIWTMNSSHHTLPTINGTQQAPGPEYLATDAAFSDDEGSTRFSCDIGSAYPDEAGVTSWNREVLFERGSTIIVEDTFELSRADSLEWNAMTPSSVRIEPGVVHLDEAPLELGGTSATGQILYDDAFLHVTLDTYPLAKVSFKRGNPWGDKLTRIRLVAKSVPATGSTRMVISR
tara:strand:- start:6957 stop:8837 length:1881 start_codon:yes stop_codon:yes gene_type:complete